MSQSNLSVVLPYELERQILETAACFAGMAYQLCTLSKYVQPWMEALMYETITLAIPFQQDADLFMRTFKERPAEFYAKNVKRLYISGILTFDQAQQVIAASSGAREVTCWIYPNTLHDNYLQQLPTHNLRQLSINLESLWGIVPLSTAFTSSLFPNLSHLEIVNPPARSPAHRIDWDGIMSLPNLTHFALGELFATHSYISQSLGKLIVECPNLKVIVIVTRDTVLIQKLRKCCLLDDRRVVVLSDYTGELNLAEYWAAVRDGELDFWQASEREIALGKNIQPEKPTRLINNVSIQAHHPVTVQ